MDRGVCTAGRRGRAVRPRRLLLVSSLATLLLSAGLLAQAPVDPRQRDLTEIRREIERLEGQLASARDRERTLEQRLEEVALELQLQRRRVAEAVAARDLAQERVEEAERQVAVLEQALDEARTSLRERLTGLYRLGSHGHLRLLLSVETGADLPSAVRLLRFLVHRDADAIDGYREAAAHLETERERLLAERLEVERWVEQAESRRGRLAAVRGRQERLLAEARTKRRALSERTEGLVDKERKLASLIDLLYGRETAPLSGRPIQDFRGVLDWPVPGEVTLGFGPRRDPRYQTEVPHNGIEIAPSALVASAAGGDPVSDREPRTVLVRAVYPGKVLFAAPFEGYGRTVIVHHPGRVFSLYAGLVETLVSQGDVLELGDSVGTASGPVYFEIRQENRPEDPLDWLR